MGTASGPFPDSTSTQGASLSQSRVEGGSSNHHVANRDQFPVALKGRRILLATESLGPVNGVSRTTLSLVEYLRANGVQLAVVAPRFEENKLKPSPSSQPEIRLHGYPLPYNPDLTVVYPFQLNKVFMRTFNPELVYLASPASLGFQFLLQIRQLQEPPVVLLNFQTDLSAYSEIIFPHFLGKYAVWLLGVVQGFLFSHHSVHTIFYPSKGIRQYLERAGAPSSRLVHLGRGVDTVLFNPSRRDEEYRKKLAPNGETILVCVCRIAPEKGFDFLAQVAEKLAADGLPFKLLIVGGNRNPAVEAEVHELFDNVIDHVVFTGFLSGVDLARAYASGDVFLHCSITETFGLVVLEGMASGLPVIARDLGGPSEIVRDQNTGYLVPPNDLELFTTLVHRVSRDTTHRAIQAVAARQYAEETTWEKINTRVAWKLAEGLELHRQQILAKKARRPIRNWIAARYYDIKANAFVPLIVRFRLNAAVGLVFMFWLIAVVPLIVHGNRFVPRSLKVLHEVLFYLTSFALVPSIDGSRKRGL